MAIPLPSKISASRACWFRQLKCSSPPSVVVVAATSSSSTACSTLPKTLQRWIAPSSTATVKTTSSPLLATLMTPPFLVVLVMTSFWPFLAQPASRASTVTTVPTPSPFWICSPRTPPSSAVKATTSSPPSQWNQPTRCTAATWATTASTSLLSSPPTPPSLVVLVTTKSTTILARFASSAMCSMVATVMTPCVKQPTS